MRYLYLFITILLTSAIWSCRSVEYVPVESGTDSVVIERLVEVPLPPDSATIRALLDCQQQECAGADDHRQPWQPAGEDEDADGHGLSSGKGSGCFQKGKSAVHGGEGADQVGAVPDGCRWMVNISNHYNYICYCWSYNL